MWQSGTGVTVEVIAELSRLEALEDEWHSLARLIPWPMVQFEWIISAARTYGCDELCVIVVRDAHAIRAVAPLVRRRHGLAHRLEFLDYRLSEPQRLIARTAQDLRILLRALKAMRLPLILRGATATCLEVRCFKEMSGAGLWLTTSNGSRDSYVPFDESYGLMDSRLSGRRRCTLKHKRRMAERLGPVEFAFLRPRPEELPALLDEFCRVESSGWKGRTGTSLQCNAQQASFFRKYCDLLAREGAVRLGFMSIGGETAAVRLDAIWGGKSWELKIGFDERFATCSPGLLLSHEALKHGQAEGLAGHHFLGEAEPWHGTWAARTSERFTMRYYPTTFGGAAALLQDAGSHVLQALASRHRPARRSAERQPAPVLPIGIHHGQQARQVR